MLILSRVKKYFSNIYWNVEQHQSELQNKVAPAYTLQKRSYLKRARTQILITMDLNYFP